MRLSLRDAHLQNGSGPPALDAVSLELRRGEVHALVGENGAGKSTLIKVMTGIYPPDEGEVLVDDERVSLRSAADAQRLGIAAIYQEPLIFPDLSVAENIFIGHQDQGRSCVGARCAPTPRRSCVPPRRPRRSPDSGEWAAGRHAAGHRDRQGHLAGRAR